MNCKKQSSWLNTVLGTSQILIARNTFQIRKCKEQFLLYTYIIRKYHIHAKKYVHLVAIHNQVKDLLSHTKKGKLANRQKNMIVKKRSRITKQFGGEK